MNILIYGGNGWIGLQFVKILENLNIEFKVSSLKVNHEFKTNLLKEIKA